MTKLIRTFLFLVVASSAVFMACNTDTKVDPAAPTTAKFIAKDSLIGNNFFQVEFSTDFRSMVYCEQILSLPGQAIIWYTDVDLVKGVPNLATKQKIDTIRSNGWPYWGHDAGGRFFLYKNKSNKVKITRRNGFNSLTTTDYGTIDKRVNSLINVSSDSTKSYFWVNYIVKTTVVGGRDSLFAVRSDKLSEILLVNSEVPNQSGSAYELTFPRWLANSEILAYPFRPLPAQPYWDIKFWDGQTKTSTQVTNDIPASVLNHHVDDLPFRLANDASTYLFSSKGAKSVAIYKRGGSSGFLSLIENYTPLTKIVNPTLTSFEPFTTLSKKTLGAYQVYEGGGIPGNTTGEIWLRGILGDTTHVKLNTLNGVTVDPEYVLGKTKIWIYYYGKTVGANTYDLRRCETPLKR